MADNRYAGQEVLRSSRGSESSNTVARLGGRRVVCDGAMELGARRKSRREEVIKAIRSRALRHRPHAWATHGAHGENAHPSLNGRDRRRQNGIIEKYSSQEGVQAGPQFVTETTPRLSPPVERETRRTDSRTHRRALKRLEDTSVVMITATTREDCRRAPGPRACGLGDGEYVAPPTSGHPRAHGDVRFPATGMVIAQQGPDVHRLRRQGLVSRRSASPGIRDGEKAG